MEQDTLRKHNKLDKSIPSSTNIEQQVTCAYLLLKTVKNRELRRLKENIKILSSLNVIFAKKM